MAGNQSCVKRVAAKPCPDESRDPATQIAPDPLLP